MTQRKLRITAGTISALAVLKDTPTADKIWAALPIKAKANTWGDEIYFSIPVKAAGELEASDVVSVGDVAYWPPGSAFCVFFGMTPTSSHGVIRAASPVNVFGAIDGDPLAFRKVKARDEVLIERV